MGCHAFLEGIVPTQGSNLCLLCLPALAGGFFTTRATWEAQNTNYKGLKILAHMGRYKKIRNQLPFPRCQEQKQGTTYDSCTQHHQLGGRTMLFLPKYHRIFLGSYASCPIHQLAHPLSPFKKPSCLPPPLGASKGICYSFCFPCAVA